jgi:hypothetical protein
MLSARLCRAVFVQNTVRYFLQGARLAGHAVSRIILGNLSPHPVGNFHARYSQVANQQVSLCTVVDSPNFSTLDTIGAPVRSFWSL